MKMKNNLGTGALMETSALKAYCDKHVPEQWRRDNDVRCQTVSCYIFSEKLIIVRTGGYCCGRCDGLLCEYNDWDAMG